MGIDDDLEVDAHLETEHLFCDYETKESKLSEVHRVSARFHQRTKLRTLIMHTHTHTHTYLLTGK